MAMTLRLSKEDEHVLARLAKAVIVRAIHEAAARRGHEEHVEDASARIRNRYADVLKRLGR